MPTSPYRSFLIYEQSYQQPIIDAIDEAIDERSKITPFPENIVIYIKYHLTGTQKKRITSIYKKAGWKKILFETRFNENDEHTYYEEITFVRGCIPLFIKAFDWLWDNFPTL